MLPILEEEIKRTPKIVQDFLQSDEFTKLKSEYMGVLSKGVVGSIFMEMDYGLKRILQHKFAQPLYCFYQESLPPDYNGYRIFLFTEDELYDMTHHDVKWSYHFKSKDAFLLRNESILCMSSNFVTLKQIKKERQDDLVLWLDTIGKMYLFKNYQNEIEIRERLFPEVEELNASQEQAVKNAYQNYLCIAKTDSKPVILKNDDLGSNLFAYIPEDSFISIYEGDVFGIMMKISRNNP